MRVNIHICDELLTLPGCVFVLTGNVRISDLGLAVELADDQQKIKGYAGTPGTVELIPTKVTFTWLYLL